MTSATPKPRAGEHTPESDEAGDRCRECGLEFVHLSVSRKLEAERNLLKIEMRDYVDNATFSRCNGLRLDAEAERDSLRERERELVEALRDLLDRVDRNGGLGEYKGGVPFATKTARELLAKHGR